MAPPAYLLTAADLAALTGYRQPARQITWLQARGWVYEAPTRRGDPPKVSRAYAEARMSGQQPQQRRQGPDVSWMMGPRRAA